MRDNNTADGVCVDEAGVEDKRYEMLMQDDRLKVEIGGNEDPGCGEGEEAEKSDTSSLAPGAAGFRNVLCTASY
jgi:hypothetical protein